MKKALTLLVLSLILLSFSVQAQHSVAREWSEMQLACIRKDLARPTVQARNLFHVSIAMYDAWAAYDNVSKPYLLGDTVGGYYAPFVGVPAPADVHAAREEAISYAAYRMLKWRYRTSPGFATTGPRIDSLFLALGYDSSYHAITYTNGVPAALGNYIAEQVIAYGLQDGANESGNYANQYYAAINPTLIPVVAGNPNVVDPNRFQQLTLAVFIDQNGNVIPVTTPPALTPEWGNVTPFALTDADKTVNTRNGDTFNVYLDPGPPPYIDDTSGLALDDSYKWNHVLVSTWSSHLDPSDSVMVDVSPGSIGNAHDYPTSFADYPNFYDLLNGGDNSTGYTINPKTGQPYAPQVVPRGDYTRVLAEFWADGPSSETPPGHWFGILNYVNSHADFVRRWNGKGPVMDELEWNVKSYLTLGGAVHDAAICAWGLKGWYDSARPITALRYMADQGQSSDTTLSNYSPAGIPLIPGFIEVVDSLDPLAADTLGPYQHVGEIKLKAWKGPMYIDTPAIHVAGVDWILAKHWWPYQRPTFVTPPFPGYISGHSTFSRSAAEAMTLLTGDEYFPGGMGEFLAPMNQYLVFEDGPSMDVTLQWAKYKDASDQCSLSRIWGGIHPPADDIPGRFLGQIMGPAAFHHAETYFDSEKPTLTVTPEVALINDAFSWNGSFTITLEYNEAMDTTVHPVVTFPFENPLVSTLTFASGAWTSFTTYLAVYNTTDAGETLRDIDVRVNGGTDVIGNVQEQFDGADLFSIDTENPAVVSANASTTVITDDDAAGVFLLTIVFDEAMDAGSAPAVTFPSEDPLANTLSADNSSGWLNATTYEAKYLIADANEMVNAIDVSVAGGLDDAGNAAMQYDAPDHFSIDTKNPEVVSVTPSITTITDADVGAGNFTLTVTFDEGMDTSVKFSVAFPNEDPLANTLAYNANASEWSSPTVYVAAYDVADGNEVLNGVDVEVATPCTDLVGNMQLAFDETDKFSIDMFSGIAGVNESTVRVYPNPVDRSSVLNIDFAQLRKEATLQLLNAQGRIVHAEMVNDANMKISIAALPAGLYLLRISDDAAEESIRVLITGNY